jgi:hypothetical protein
VGIGEDSVSGRKRDGTLSHGRASWAGRWREEWLMESDGMATVHCPVCLSGQVSARIEPGKILVRFMILVLTYSLCALGYSLDPS